MPRELMKEKRERAIAIAQRMDEHFPAAECALHYWGDPFKLTIAVLLSAQTTDQGCQQSHASIMGTLPDAASTSRCRCKRRRGDYPYHRLSPCESRELRQMCSNGDQ